MGFEISTHFGSTSADSPVTTPKESPSELTTGTIGDLDCERFGRELQEGGGVKVLNLNSKGVWRKKILVMKLSAGLSLYKDRGGTPKITKSRLVLYKAKNLIEFEDVVGTGLVKKGDEGLLPGIKKTSWRTKYCGGVVAVTLGERLVLLRFRGGVGGGVVDSRRFTSWLKGEVKKKMPTTTTQGPQPTTTPSVISSATSDVLGKLESRYSKYFEDEAGGQTVGCDECVEEEEEEEETGGLKVVEKGF